MKGIGILLVLGSLAGCASDPALEVPAMEGQQAEAPPKCPPGYYKMCEEKQGDEFCTCIRPRYNPPNTGVQY